MNTPNKLSRSLDDVEYEIWSSAVAEAWAVAQVPEREKMPYQHGFLDCFERVLARGHALNSTPYPNPVFSFYWDTSAEEEKEEQDNANALMKAAILGGMDPALAKKSIEKIFSAGYSAGGLDEAYNNSDS